MSKQKKEMVRKPSVQEGRKSSLRPEPEQITDVRSTVAVPKKKELPAKQKSNVPAGKKKKGDLSKFGAAGDDSYAELVGQPFEEESDWKKVDREADDDLLAAPFWEEDEQESWEE
jgi:hypothetical protein